MIARTAAAAVRDMIARHDAIRQLSADFERHAEAEQLLVEGGWYADAENAHEACRVLARALTAEMDDPR